MEGAARHFILENSVESHRKIFSAVLNDLSSVKRFRIPDALDELQEESLANILNNPRTLFKEAGPADSCLRLYILGRRHPPCPERSLNILFQIRVDSVHDIEVQNDIDLYIYHRVDDIARISGYISN